MLRSVIFTALAVAFGVQARAQFSYVLDQSISVGENDNQLPMPWAGGLNSPQINTMDLDGDGDADMVVFDRNADKILTFLNIDQSYEYAPDYEVLFPEEITQWLLLRDFNCDGKKDIFTSDPFGMTAWVNITTPGEKLRWRKFNPGFPILTAGFSGPVNVQVNSTDIPAIDDVDGDGDLDILVARFSGVGSVEFHKNVSIDSGSCDSLRLVKVTTTWGEFEECNCGSFIFGSVPCFPGGRMGHAGGKSLLTIDLDDDGDRELLLSEESCENLYLLPNVGSSDDALMTSYSKFPTVADPLTMQIFPAAYHEDMDFDGLADMVVASNIYGRNSGAINFDHTVYLYRNTGTTQLPNFTFVQDDFLQNRMIDVGDNAVPAFFDSDADGDLDMFIGQFLGNGIAAGVSFYENTGSLSEPSYALITGNYAGLRDLGFYNLKPQFADMDGDGKTDLVFTATDFQTGITSLYFIPNAADGHLDLEGQAAVDTEFQIVSTENVFVYDVNEDGAKDLLLGKSTGAVEYWINNGPAGFWNFSLQDPSYLGLGTSTSRQNVALTAEDVDADGTIDLVMGDQRGFITLFPDFRNEQPQPTIQEIIYNSFTESYGTVNLGGRIWPTVVNLFNSDRPAIVVGNALGGIHVLKNDDSHTLPPDPEIDLYPNPLARGNSFTIRIDRPATVQFFSVLGQAMTGELNVPAHQSFEITPNNLSPGVYIARFSVKGKIYSRRLVIY